MGIKERISVLQHSEVSQHRATIVLELRIKGKPEQEAAVGSQLHPKEFEVGQDFAAVASRHQEAQTSYREQHSIQFSQGAHQGHRLDLLDLSDGDELCLAHSSEPLPRACLGEQSPSTSLPAASTHSLH